MAPRRKRPPKVGGIDQLVVVGSSAGGIEALSALLAEFPADLPAAIVVAQHIDPSKESHLQEILQRTTRLRVKTVAEHEPLEAGTVFVVPANRHVQITDHEVRLTEDTAKGPKPSVNRLLTTAAQSFGEQLIAVILSGTGSDGAAGAETVKREGGTVIIQNPETARYPGMPRSLAPALVDIVAEPDEIGPIVAKLVQGIYEFTPTAGRERELRAFLDELRSKRGIDFNSYKLPTIQRRLQRRFVAANVKDLAGYQAYVDAHPSELNELVRSLLIKVTEFLRDEELFAHLREHLLPRLLVEARKRDNQLRLWSAGCATGQEAYSLAIQLAEVLGDELEQLGVRIFATDLDAGAIEFARRGIYPPSAVQSLPGDLIERYFTATDGEYEVQKRIRSLVIFGEHDLAQRAAFPSIDLILCRNVLIYFTPELQKRALQLFAFSLRDAGYLVLGKSESLTQLPELFVSENPHLRVYRRQGGRTLIPGSFIGATNGTPSPTRRLVGSARAAAVPPAGGQSSAAPLSDATLDALPVGVVIVDRRYHIRSINPAARRLLDIHVPPEGEDLVHLLRVADSGPLRSAIDTAFRTAQASKVDEMALPDPASGRTRSIEIVCHPDRVGAGETAPDSVVIIIADISTAVAARAGEQGTPSAEHMNIDELEARLAALAENNAELREANDRVLAAHGDMLASREQLQTDNAALQAASEEVETLNEELQASNEELETLNEELQSTLEELNATNDDLNARTIELRRLSDEERVQRRRFEELLSSIGDAVLVVDAAGRIVLVNPAYEQLFGGTTTGFVAELPDGQRVPFADGPQQRAARGEAFNMEFAVTVPDGSRRWLDVNSRPVQAAGGLYSILIIRDMTDQSLRRQAEQRFGDVLELAPDAIFITDSTGAIVLLNRQAEEQFGYSRDALLGQSIDVLVPDNARGRHAAHRTGYYAQPRTRTMGVGLELSARRKDGSEFPVEISLSALHEPDGSVLITSIVRDITDRSLRRLEERFLAMASHELRTPLTALSGFAQLLTRGLATAKVDGDLRKTADEVVGQAHRLQALIDDLVDTARLQNGQVPLDATDLDLVALLRHTVDLAQAMASGQTVESDLPLAPVRVHGDPGRLEQVIMNLLTNAITYAPGTDHIHLRLKVDGRHAEIQVQDYGPGIPAEDQSNLFSPFYQVNRLGQRPKAGLGLGLFICKQFVEAHGGNISVSSEVGTGSTFTVRLPLLETASSPG